AWGYGIGMSTDGGATFVTRNSTMDGMADNSVQDLVADGTSVYVATDLGLSVSNDRGVSFATRTMPNGLPSNNITGLSVLDHVLYVATDAGVAISADGGTTFQVKTIADGLGDNVTFCIKAFH
ncbi:MAG: FG-GAP-like repeat-containing protein, partial [Bdellovibrionota bacterium]